MTMQRVHFDRFYRYAELVSLLESYVAEVHEGYPPAYYPELRPHYE